MSMRPAEEGFERRPVMSYAQATTGARAEQLRTDIETMRQTNAAIENDALATSSPIDEAISFDHLSETEKSAATIGVNPDEWRPIGWMNQQHYNTLLKKNALGGRLTQQIEAYKVVASGDAVSEQAYVGA